MLSNWKITSILLEREWAKYEPGKPPSLDIFHSVMVKYTTALVVITIFIRFFRSAEDARHHKRYFFLHRHVLQWQRSF